MLDVIPNWAITFWPIWPTLLFIILGFGTVTFKTEKNADMVIHAGAWISGLLWIIWAIHWLGMGVFNFICYLCGCEWN